MAGDSTLIQVQPPCGIVFFAHGSRDPLWRLPIEAVAQALRRQHPDAACVCAYLELNQPDLASAIHQLMAQGCQHITILPMFLGTGRHARNDLPQLVATLQRQYPQLRLEIATAVGEDPRVTELLAAIAAQHLHKATHL